MFKKNTKFGEDWKKNWLNPSNPRETTNVWSCDALVHGRATGDLGQMRLWRQLGKAGFLALEAIVWVAGFHLKFLASKSCEVWPQPPKSLKSPRNGIRQYRLGLFDWVRGLWLSVLSRRIASKTLKWRQVKARNRKSVRMSVWIILLYTVMNQWLMKTC